MSIAHSQQPDIVSDYREYLPPVALREHVLCLWTQSIRDSRTVYAHRVLPDACVDLVFFQGQPPAVVGPWTEAFLTNLAPGTRITGVRFQPGKAAAVLGLPVCVRHSRASATWPHFVAPDSHWKLRCFDI